MAINSVASRAGLSWSLRQIQELIYDLPIRQALKNVLLVYAHHCDYFSGKRSRPKRETVALMAGMGERQVKYLMAELRANRKCRRCTGSGRLPQGGACPCQRSGKGWLIPEDSGTGGAGVASSYALNLTAMKKICPQKRGQFGAQKGAVSDQKGAVSSRKGGSLEQRNKEDCIDRNRSYLTEPRPSPKPSRNAEAKTSVGSSAWDKLHPGLKDRLFRELRTIGEAEIGQSRFGWTPEQHAEAARNRVLRACEQCGIWNRTARQLAQETYAAALAEKRSQNVQRA